jgi:nitrite reductase/ring-hydroxylating ferredoxin subunit
MSEERWVEVAALEALPPGRVLGVDINGRRIALVHWKGNIYALEGVCPHQGGPLAEGALWEDGLECPWHHFRYDPATGQNVFPANVYPDDLPGLAVQLRPVVTYRVRVKEGRIEICLADADR